MDTKMIINKCGRYYDIKRMETETSKQLIERSWFVVNNVHLKKADELNLKEDVKNAEKNSRIWFNYKVLGCKYSNDLEKKIEEIEKQIFV